MYKGGLGFQGKLRSRHIADSSMADTIVDEYTNKPTKSLIDKLM